MEIVEWVMESVRVEGGGRVRLREQTFRDGIHYERGMHGDGVIEDLDDFIVDGFYGFKVFI